MGWFGTAISAICNIFSAVTGTVSRWIENSYQFVKQQLSLREPERIIANTSNIRYKISFRSTYRQILDAKFCMTRNSCYICQRNFRSPSDYDNHIGFHTRYESTPCAPCSTSFNISYNHSADANTLTFSITSNKNVSIDKIVLIRSGERKLMHNIDKSEIRCFNERIYSTSVDCSLFDIATKQPLIIIYRNSDDAPSTRRLEEFVFIRDSNRVPKAKLELVHKLPQHFPAATLRSLGKGNYNEKDIKESSPIMRQFLLDKRLRKSNYVEVLSFLLQTEDHFILSQYEKIILTNSTITHLGGDNYSFVLSETKEVKQFLGSFDQIVISGLTAIDDYYDENIFEFSCDRTGLRKYYGFVDKIEGNTVYFSLRGKVKIPIYEKFNIKIYPCRIPFRYQYEALRRISNSDHIINVLFPTANYNNHLSNCSLDFFNKYVKSNAEQAQAVKNIVNGQNNSMPFILFGPPGTGKSTTIIESVLQLWRTKPLSRILVTSGSNAACDEVAKRLCEIFEKIDCKGHNLLRIYATSSGKKMDNTEEILVEASNYAYIDHFYPSLKSIYLFRIVVATLSICGKLVQADISDRYFSHIIIDECAASTETEALVGIAGLMGPNTKLILSGDPKQLGPVLKCKPAQKFGFDISMMERLLNSQCYAVDRKTNSYDKSILAILIRNFRSNAGILSIANELCYNSQLLALAKPELTDWAHQWKNLPSKNCPIIFHSVRGQTEKEDGGTSPMNSEEIEIVMDYVQEIIKNGINGRKVEQKEIGIISPYKKQYSEIRKQLNKNGWTKIETGSAETFQGQEKPIIIISTVKSNTRHIGFLDNLKRLNVMLTRAQALMIIVGNPKSLQNDANWLQVLKYFQKKKAFTGKYFKLPKELLNVDSALDVSKTGNTFTSNRTEFKTRNQPSNAFMESNKTCSHDNKKENAFVTAATSAKKDLSANTPETVLRERRTNTFPTLTTQPSSLARSKEDSIPEYRDENLSFYRKPPFSYILPKFLLDAFKYFTSTILIFIVFFIVYIIFKVQFSKM